MRRLFSYILLIVIFTATSYLSYGESVVSMKDLEKQAKGGDSSAQYKMGTYYIKGDGVEKNVKKAIKMFTVSATNGYTKFGYIMGQLYRDDIYIKRSESKARNE